MKLTDEVIDRQWADGGARAFGPTVLTCPDCGHGIDPHGIEPGGECGAGGCGCLMQPNGIASLLIEDAKREGASNE